MALLKLLDENFIGDKINELPRLIEIDDIESNGSILLIDFSKQDYTLNPIGGEGEQTVGKISNLFDKSELITTSTSININCCKVSENIKLEKTEKNGLHFMFNPNYFKRENYATVEVKGGAKEYIQSTNGSNASTENHEYYISMWGKETFGENWTYFSSYNDTTSTNTSLYYFNKKFNNGESIFKNFDSNTLKKILASYKFLLVSAGYCGLNKINSKEMYENSFILYRFYVEDLTISGRTFDDVSKIDTELHRKAFSEGGCFYNDVYTNPTTAFE